VCYNVGRFNDEVSDMSEQDDFGWLPELTMLGNGRWHSSLTGKGIPEQYENGTTEMVRIAVDPAKPAFPVYAGIGATINLGNYEFARIQVTVNAVGDIKLIEETEAYIEAVAGEILNREVASVKGRERENKAVPDPPEHIQYCIIGLDYGLTVNVGNMNSRKIDRGYSIPCRPSDVEEAFGKMAKYLGDKIQEKVSALRAGNKVKPKPKKKASFGTHGFGT
jgi:hypothetical protein